MARNKKPNGLFKEAFTVFQKKGRMDLELLAIIIIMLFFGLVMVASASSVTALYKLGDSMYFLKKQLIVAVIGFVLMIYMSKIDYHVLAKPNVVLAYMAVTWILMLVTAFVGEDINGARRWINIGPFSLQPSELAKIGIVLLMSCICSRQSKEKLQSFKHGCILYLVIIGCVCVPLLLQPHKSAMMLIGIVAMVIVIVAGARIRNFMVFSPIVVCGLLFIMFKDKYSAARILNFADPFKDATGAGWQGVQSLYAIGSGGLFGLGLGRSRQKYLNIPEPQNDFIFSIICEELGFIGAALVIILFVLLLFRCIKIAMEAPDKLGSLIAIGITALIMVQVVINIAVVTAWMPVTGMPLPFFSAGGTSLMFTLASMGIVLNVSRQSTRAVSGVKPTYKQGKPRPAAGKNTSAPRRTSTARPAAARTPMQTRDAAYRNQAYRSTAMPEGGGLAARRSARYGRS